MFFQSSRSSKQFYLHVDNHVCPEITWANLTRVNNLIKSNGLLFFLWEKSLDWCIEKRYFLGWELFPVISVEQNVFYMKFWWDIFSLNCFLIPFFSLNYLDSIELLVTLKILLNLDLELLHEGCFEYEHFKSRG